MKEEIRQLLEESLPLVDLDTDFLFPELDSLDIATILMRLSDKYGVKLDHSDVTPRNFKSLESLAEMVKAKLA
jgi:acyl carrier protein